MNNSRFAEKADGMIIGYWYFDDREDDWVFVPSASELE